MNWRTLYQTLQLLSIDVAVGALASGSLGVHLLAQPMPWIWYILLPVSVWVIYTADHLLDAWRLKDQSHTPRHLFHHQYFAVLLPIWLLALLFCLLVAPFFIPVPLLYFGLSMGGLVLVHLGLVQLIGDRISWFLHKELGVGLIYAVGIWGAPMALYQGEVPLLVWICALQFLVLALINLLVFSIYEMQIDEQDGHTSFVRAIGKRAAKRWVTGLSLFVIALCLFCTWQEGPLVFWWIQAVYGVMLGLLTWILHSPDRFAPQESYRLWGDAVFLFPLVCWFL